MTLSSRGAGVLVLAALTLAHGAVQLTRRAEGKRVLVSTLAPGTPLPALVAGIATAKEVRQCRIVVAFDPVCPYSAAAAARERRSPQSPRMPVVWIADSRWEGFHSLPHVESRITSLNGALDALEVRGVPAAFLVGADGVVLRAWPYQGDESHGALLDACAAAPSPD